MSRSLPSRGLLAAVLALIAIAATGPVFAQDEAELLRQIKSDLFDRKWDAVLGSCDMFISRHPSSADLPRAFYYRAQALEHIRGRENDAIRAYGEFITRFPDVSRTMREDALLSRLTLAASQWEKGDKSHVGLIMDGMKQSGYPKMYAAVQASKIGHKPAHTQALPILNECAKNERDAELKNECAVAVLRIDPKALGTEVDTGSAASAGPAGAAGEVKLIRLEVFDKAQNKVVVRVNMPIAFAELILDAIEQGWRDEINKGLQKHGISSGNLESFWKAIKEGGPQTILEIDNDEEKIRFWVE